MHWILDIAVIMDKHAEVYCSVNMNISQKLPPTEQTGFSGFFKTGKMTTFDFSLLKKNLS